MWHYNITPVKLQMLVSSDQQFSVWKPCEPIAPTGSPDPVARGMDLAIHAEQMVGYGLLVGHIENCYCSDGAPFTNGY